MFQVISHTSAESHQCPPFFLITELLLSFPGVLCAEKEE